MKKKNNSKPNSNNIEVENKALARYSPEEIKVKLALEAAWDKKLGNYHFGGKKVDIKSLKEEDLVELTKALKGFKYNKSNNKVSSLYKELTKVEELVVEEPLVTEV